MSTADGSVVGTTKIVDHGPSSERFDLVIMGDGYQSAQLAQFATDTQSFVDQAVRHGAVRQRRRRGGDQRPSRRRHLHRQRRR